HGPDRPAAGRDAVQHVHGCDQRLRGLGRGGGGIHGGRCRVWCGTRGDGRAGAVRIAVSPLDDAEALTLTVRGWTAHSPTLVAHGRGSVTYYVTLIRGGGGLLVAGLWPALVIPVIGRPG